MAPQHRYTRLARNFPVLQVVSRAARRKTEDRSSRCTLAQCLAELALSAQMDLYSRPASLFIADFVGTNPMNLLPAEFDGGGIPRTYGQT